MAYYTQYKCKAFNRDAQLIEIDFDLKDAIPPAPGDISLPVLPLVEFRCEYFNGNEEKYDPVIISQKAVIVVRAKYGSSSTINHEMFYANAYDQWRVTARIDGEIVFIGFVTMENEPYQNKDKPYNIVITATDGLGLLKNIPLTDYQGYKFNDKHNLITYIAGALTATNLTIPIRIYCNRYHRVHKNRYDTYGYDMFNQTKLHYRTFLKDVNEFVDSYTALEIILSKWCVLYQHHGHWVISDVGEMQYGYGPVRYYGEYAHTGISYNAYYDTDLPSRIGKELKINVINQDQYVSYLYPVKSVKTKFNYEVPDELVTNSKLNRLGAFISPLSGNGYAAWEKVGWEAYYDDPAYQKLYTGAKKSYIRTDLDVFSTELDRYYVLEYDSTVFGIVGYWIRNTNNDFYVDKGDVIKISVSVRLLDFQSTNNNNEKFVFSKVYLLKNGSSGTSRTDYYTLTESGAWTNNDVNNWGSPFVVDFKKTDDPNDGNMTDWVTLSVESKSIPADGTLYVCLRTGALNNPNNKVHFKDLSIEYVPYIKGSKLSSKGDYWLTEQSINIKDKIEEEVFISDSSKRIIKGSIWESAGTGLYTPEWYYLDNPGYYHFKELSNLGRYRHQYRRQKRIQGTFSGVMQIPTNTTKQVPLSFHKHITFENDYKLNLGLRLYEKYMLTAPLEIDYVNGNWKGTLINCGDENDAAQTGNTHVFNYIF